jgi:hypothetical protein
MSNILVSPFELARIVAKQMAIPNADEIQIQPTLLTLMSVLTKYVNHSFKQISDNDAVCCNVPALG